MAKKSSPKSKSSRQRVKSSNLSTASRKKPKLKKKQVVKTKTNSHSPPLQALAVKNKKKTVAKPKPTVVAVVKVSLKKGRRSGPSPGAAVAENTGPMRLEVRGEQKVSDERLPPTSEQLKKIRSGLTKRDLERFRKMLMAKRAEILGDVASMQSDVRSKRDTGNLSHMPVHMADVGSDNYEQEFTLGLVESERLLLREIDEALMRIEQGIYGVCVEKGVPIGKQRLEAKPWAKYCIEAARELERRGQNKKR